MTRFHSRDGDDRLLFPRTCALGNLELIFLLFSHQSCLEYALAIHFSNFKYKIINYNHSVQLHSIHIAK